MALDDLREAAAALRGNKPARKRLHRRGQDPPTPPLPRRRSRPRRRRRPHRPAAGPSKGAPMTRPTAASHGAPIGSSRPTPNGRRSSRPSSTTSPAKRARSARSRARTGTTTRRARTSACAATCPSSLGDEVRVRDGLAELLPADPPDAVRDGERPELLHGAHRGPVRALRRAPRPRVRRRPEADRPALLHERDGSEVHPCEMTARRGVSAFRTPGPDCGSSRSGARTPARRRSSSGACRAGSGR